MTVHASAGSPAHAAGAQRRGVLLLPLAWALGAVGPAWIRPATAASLPSAVSLAHELSGALAAGRALVVMVSLDGCPFCRVVRDSYLAPLVRETGQPVVQLDMRSAAVLRDFEGRETTHGDLVRALGVKIAPTVLFIGREGREIAPRLVGASVPDFYGAYLEERLRIARRAVGWPAA